MKLDNTWYTYHTFWLFIIIAMFTFGTWWLINSTFNTVELSPPDKRDTVSRNPSPLPTPTASRPRIWDSYRTDKMQVYFMYPTTFRVDESANRIVISLNYPERPLRYLSIDKPDKSSIQHLLDLSIGGQYKDPNIKEIDSITTRLPDISVDLIQSYVYETNEVWEAQGPFRTVIVPMNDAYYRINMLYSNLTDIEKDANSKLDANYINAFNIILDTLSIFGNPTTPPKYDETFWRTFDIEPFDFTFVYPGYWMLNLNDNITYGQSVEYYDPSYGNSECRGDCPVFFMSFSQMLLTNADDVITVVKEQNKDNHPENFKWETITTDKNIIFTKVTGIPGGAYYKLFTIHNGKLYTISVGAGANTMLIDPTDPETKEDLDTFQKSLNSFTFLK